MMEKKLIQKLISLTKYDFDALRALEQALTRLESEAIGKEVAKLKQDHERHIAILGKAVRDLGGTPPTPVAAKDLFQMSGVRALGSAEDDKEILTVLRGNAELLKRVYGDSLTVDLTPKTEAIIKRLCEDESRHIEAIDKVLADHSWQMEPVRLDLSAS